MDVITLARVLEAVEELHAKHHLDFVETENYGAEEMATMKFGIETGSASVYRLVKNMLDVELAVRDGVAE